MKLYYGWILVVTLGVTETISWGILYYAFSVYLAPMEAEMHSSRGDMSGAFSLGLLVAGAAAIPVGRWLDRHGPRTLMTVGSIFGTLMVLAWSGVSNLTQLYLVWVGMGLAMSATLYDPAFATATRWFELKRLRALTIITLVAGFASTIFLPLAQWLVEHQTWRPSLVSLAIILAVGTIPAHALLLRRRPEDLGFHPDGEPLSEERVAVRHVKGMRVGEALRDRSFRWIVVAFWLSTLATIAVGVHLVPYLVDRGYDPGFAAVATGLVGAMQVVARLLMAPLGERASPRTLAAVTLAMVPLSLLVLLLVPSTAGVIAFVVLFGAARGTNTLTRPALLAHQYGRRQFASIAGVLQSLLSVAAALAPVLAGVAYDAFGGYETVFWLLTLLSMGSVAAVLPVGGPSPRAVAEAGEAIQSQP